mgnify:CR=1 FL=1
MQAHPAGCPSAGQPGLSGPLLLFCGAIPPHETEWQALRDLLAQCPPARAVLSRTWLESVGQEKAAPRLPRAEMLAAPLADRAVAALAEGREALIVPALSPNTAAKVALGLRDSVPSLLIAVMLQLGKRVLALASALEPNDEGDPLGLVRSAPPALAQMVNAHRKTLERLGVRFVPAADLVAEGVRALAPPDDAPRTLPAPKPSLKREFVTEEDLRALKAEGKTLLEIGPAAIVTDIAREYALREGIELRQINR